VYVRTEGIFSSGWMLRSQLTKTPAAAVGTTAYVIDGTIDGTEDGSRIWGYMYAEPASGGAWIEVLYGGTRVTVISEENGWSYCHANGFAGYIKSDKLTTTPPAQETITMQQGTAMLTRKEVNFYKDMSTSSGTWGKIEKNKTLTIFYTRGDWAYTQTALNGQAHSGYVKLSDLMTFDEYYGNLEPADKLIPGPGEMLLYVDSPGGNVNLREGPGENARVVTRFVPGTCVTGKLITPGWAFVRSIDNAMGYMMAEFLVTADGTRLSDMSTAEDDKQEETKPAEDFRVVQTGNSGRLNLRKTPESTGRLINKYSNGTPVRMIEVLGQWAKVEIDGNTGYVMVKFLSAPAGSQPEEDAPEQEETPAPEAPEQEEKPANLTYVIETGNDGRLHLRKRASAASSSLGLFENGTVVTVESTENGWAKVEVGGKTGYMKMSFLRAYAMPSDPPATEEKPEEKPEETPVEPDAPETPEETHRTMYVQTGNDGRLHLRKRASTSSSSLGLFKNGTAVTVVGTQGSWAQVQVNGKEGYMKLSFLTGSAPESAPVKPEENKPEDTPEQPANPPAAGGSTYYVKTGNEGRLHLRARGTSNSKSLGLFENGTPVTVHAHHGAWVSVTVNGQTGYMKFTFLSTAP